MFLFEKVSQSKLKEILDIYNKIIDHNEDEPLDMQLYKDFAMQIDKLASERIVKPLSEDLGTLFSKQNQKSLQKVKKQVFKQC